MQPLSLLFALLLAFNPSVVDAKKKPGDSILLSQVKTLTLRSGQKTTARRVAALPQLACVGGNAAGLYEVDVMRCKNAGSEYDTEDVQWTCQASLPPEFKSGSTEVVCEGYNSSDDPYVLKGSCAVEYRLVLTDAGEEKYGRTSFERAYRNPSGKTVGSALATGLFWMAFVGIAGYILYNIFFAAARGNNNGGNRLNRRPGGGFGGGGGGGYDDDDHTDPPPPYTPRAPKSGASHRANSQNSDGSWRPGFWTGAAGGAAAGYAASALRGGGRNAGGYRYDAPQAQAGPSNWFGRAGGGGAAPSFGGSSFGTPSSSRYESTGFGGTRRR